ncbi:MAG: nucleoside phosphorylase [Deltaproteobacteria bacterium]|nr:nucleoside phosphorylase [Deltaproteobacteria bacterium]
MTVDNHQATQGRPGAVTAAIVNPVKGKNSPDPGPVALMVSNAADLQRLTKAMAPDLGPSRNVLMSRLFCPVDADKGGALIGPVIGAPYAVILFENLIAWGVRRLLYFGWGGAIDPDVRIGDVVLATGAIVDEGTSRQYDQKEHAVVRSSGGLTRKISKALDTGGLNCHRGLVWTTDALFRETGEKLMKFQKAGAMAVEMELSALFSVARFRGVEAAGILAVSDELTSLKWQPGFGDKRFKQTRRNLCEVLAGFEWQKS